MAEFTDAPEPSTQLYHPLQDAASSGSDVDEHLSWGIRLLLLLPGDRDSTIQCSLSVSTMGNSLGAYEALSYVWGSPATTDTVILDGRPVLVTPNLQYALRCLRYKTSSRLLWVDALCIDQKSTEEKSVQVPRMWAVFTFCRRALIFLGDESDDSGRALHLLHMISQLQPTDLDTMAKMVGDRSLASSWNALSKLAQRPWWGRAWIIQEYAVATNIHFLCGTHILQGEEFSKAISLLREYRFKSIVPQEQAYLIRRVAPTSILHLWSTREEYQKGLQPCKQAVDILYKFRGSQSSDPRDKIFSLYKLIGRTPELAPNYGQSVQDLYQAVVKTTVEYSGTLEILSHHNRNVRSQLMLPSWCPDWTI
ncbi:heterokaryon incompatibility protein-domain-containing protein, partial [Bipolaris maydis]